MWVLCRSWTHYDSHVTSTSAAEQQLRDLALLRRVRDRMDREYAQPLDVEALARGVNMSAGHLSRQFLPAEGIGVWQYSWPTWKAQSALA